MKFYVPGYTSQVELQMELSTEENEENKPIDDNVFNSGVKVCHLSLPKNVSTTIKGRCDLRKKNYGILS